MYFLQNDIHKISASGKKGVVLIQEIERKE